MDLGNAQIAANVPVKDMKRALTFYGETLGLKAIPITDWIGSVIGKDGSMLILAPREKASSDEDNVNFTVTDIEAVVKTLKGRGVKFNDYDLPHMKTVDHIAESDGFKAAWFKDSEGNTLQINQSPQQG
jgi:catechol 2,3-dioxygenase-like lactoylglutathione lyase family enzyme